MLEVIKSLLLGAIIAGLFISLFLYLPNAVVIGCYVGVFLLLSWRLGDLIRMVIKW